MFLGSSRYCFCQSICYVTMNEFVFFALPFQIHGMNEIMYEHHICKLVILLMDFQLCTPLAPVTKPIAGS